VRLDRIYRAIPRAVSSAALTIALGAALASAQSVALDSIEYRLVSRAEIEGRALQRTKVAVAPATFDGAKGTSARLCTRVPGQRAASITKVGLAQVGQSYRSGEFVVGGRVEELVAGKPRKVWWAPLNNAADMPPLVLRARSIRTPTDTFRLVVTTIAASIRPGPARREYAFPSAFALPYAGPWLVTTTSGSNWGCFVLTVSPE
jgi:hypothetical protein